MFYPTSSRISVGLVTGMVILITVFLSSYSLRHPTFNTSGEIDFFISFLGVSIVLGWLGVGPWMGVVATTSALLLVGLASLMGVVSFGLLCLALLGFVLVSYCVFSRIRNLRSEHRAVVEEWEEHSNDLSAKLSLHRSQKLALQKKIGRYETLEEFTLQLSRTLSLQKTIKKTIDQVVQIMHSERQICLLYLVDSDQLSLQGSHRLAGETIKHKKGDMLDYSVLKQRQPLIVEDIRKDFRFNIEEQPPECHREFRSLISVPLSDEKGIIGVLRVDSPFPDEFVQDDLRALTIIADLATTAIRNATLFAVTQELAIKDGLTGLYTYRYWTQRLQEEIQRAFRSGNPLSLILMDIDWFKRYNDQFGHISGDVVLKQLGKRLLELSEPGEIVARYGGEEFAVVLPGCDIKSAFAKAEKIRQTVAEDVFSLRLEPTRVTLYLGVATFPMQAKDREELIRLADQALYQAKALGRNQTCSLSLS